MNMPFVEKSFYDLNKSRNANQFLTELEIPYIVLGVQDEDAAFVLVADKITSLGEKTVENMVLDHLELDQQLGPDSFKIRAVYETTKSETNTSGSGQNQPSFSFDTGGGTMHMTQSLATKGIYAARGQTAQSFGGAIEVDENNDVKGIDITTPLTSFNETHYFKPSRVSAAYRRTVADLTGRVNSSRFKGYAAGEVLFQGASGTRRGTKATDLWEINFKFIVSPNRKGIKINDITIAEKEGWDYMWFRYEAQVSSDSKALIKKPVAAYVEQVYERRSFGALKIGTS